MAYFIFKKNSDGVVGSLYRIAENESYLNNLNINLSNYKVIEDSQSNFENVKYGFKCVEKYNNNVITYLDNEYGFSTKVDVKGVTYSARKSLKNYVDSVKLSLKSFLDVNKNNLNFNVFNDYYNQLNNLNINTVIPLNDQNEEIPLNSSLEQYFKDQNLISINPLQIP
jgi:hypothetical protein